MQSPMRCVHTRSEDRDLVDSDGHRNLPVTDANMRDIIEQRRLRSNRAAFHDRDPGSGHKFDSESQSSEGMFNGRSSLRSPVKNIASLRCCVRWSSHSGSLSCHSSRWDPRPSHLSSFAGERRKATVLVRVVKLNVRSNSQSNSELGPRTGMGPSPQAKASSPEVSSRGPSRHRKQT